MKTTIASLLIIYSLGFTSCQTGAKPDRASSSEAKYIAEESVRVTYPVLSEVSRLRLSLG